MSAWGEHHDPAFLLPLINVDVMTGCRHLKSNFASRYRIEWKGGMYVVMAALERTSGGWGDFLTFSGVRLVKF